MSRLIIHGFIEPHKYEQIIISPKLEISEILWFGSEASIRSRRRLPPHAKACVSCNITATSNSYLTQPRVEEPYRFWRISQNQNGRRRPLCENMMKKRVHSITSYLM